MDEEKIVIAADTLGIDAAGIRHEDQCKLVLLGNYVFAAASISSFSSTWPNRPAWDAKIEAQAAYRDHERDMEAAARDWLERAERYFSDLSVADRLRAGSLVASDPDHILTVGVFVGWSTEGKAEFILECVRFKEPSVEQVEHRIDIPRARDLPYTTNVITQELMEGHSNRASAARKEWAITNQSI